MATALDEIKRTHAKSSSAAVLDRYLAAQVFALRTAESALRDDEPDAVHDLRVAVRRLRSALRVFRPMFRPDAVGPIRTELAWLSDLLGEARDVEVLRHGITTSLHDLPDELVLGPVWVELDRALAKPEANTTRAVRAALDSPRYRVLRSALDHLLLGRSYRPRAEKPAKKRLRRRVGKALDKVNAAVSTAAGTDQAAHDAALHNVRKKAKRLRYACEAAEPVLGKNARKLGHKSKKIQRTLGDHHDTVEIRTTLRELGARAQGEGGNGFTFGLVHGQLDERATALEQEFAARAEALPG
ncbi:MAG TPA: CHAD domain-containing protein [Pseudonocardiaceae bacterium]|jgi:CHAD domain-containing protein|nr:CHAD domain-containing protein [Pseudonocardiaceae bacterium]